MSSPSSSRRSFFFLRGAGCFGAAAGFGAGCFGAAAGFDAGCFGAAAGFDAGCFGAAAGFDADFFSLAGCLCFGAILESVAQQVQVWGGSNGTVIALGVY